MSGTRFPAKYFSQKIGGTVWWLRKAMHAVFRLASTVPWRSARPLVILAIFVVFWSLLLTLAVRSEFLWDLLSPRFEAAQQFNTQNLLMGSANTQDRVLVVGDSAFIESISKLSGGGSEVEFLTIDAIDPRDIAGAIKALAQYRKIRPGKARFCQLIVQASPYFVARMRDRGKRQEGAYLLALQRKALPFVPNKLTETFFQTLAKWAKTRSINLDTSDPQRPPRFPPQISKHDPNLENWIAVEKQIRKTAIPVLIVADRRFSDYSQAPQLLNFFNQDFRGRIVSGEETSGLTKWADFSDLPEMAWAKCSSA